MRWVFLLLASCTLPSLPSVDPVILSGQGCGRATAYDNANKILTSKGKTHVTWLDSVGGKFLVRIKTLDNANATWSETTAVGESVDNHGGPALTIDSAGHLHIVYHPHHHPVCYRRSVRPDDASAWGPIEHVGNRATYPSLICGADDTLYLAVRESHSKAPWRLNLYSKRADEPWSPPTTLLTARGPGYCQFGQNLASSNDGTLHLSLWVYEDHDADRLKTTIGYLRSADGGVNWSKGDGTPVALPTDTTKIDVIAHHPPQAGIVRGGAMAIDAKGSPHLFYRSLRDWPGELIHADLQPSGKWRKRGLGMRTDNRRDPRQIIEAVSASIDTSGRILLGLMTLDVGHENPERGWGDPRHEVGWSVSEDGGETWVSEAVTATDPKTARWLPSIERATGHNRIIRPAMIYTDGGRGDSNKDMMSNRVIFLRR